MRSSILGNLCRRSFAGLVLAGFCGSAFATEDWQQYVDQVRVKKALADSMTPEQYQAHVEKMARFLAARKASSRPASTNAIVAPAAPGDTCAAATFEISSLPFNTSDTTVGATDNYDLPADTTNPTCEAAMTCTGAGPAGSLPRGAIYTGTGTAPDRAFRIQTSANCTLSITMDPTGAQDLSLILYGSTCSSNLADCGCVDDTGVGGVAESVSLDAVAGQTYFVVVDGYSTGAVPPGPSGPYTLNVTATSGSCTLVPVELQNFSVD